MTQHNIQTLINGYVPSMYTKTIWKCLNNYYWILPAEDEDVHRVPTISE